LYKKAFIIVALVSFCFQCVIIPTNAEQTSSNIPNYSEPYLNLKNIYGKNEEDILNEIRTLEVKISDKNYIAKLYIGLAEINARKQDYSRARDYLKPALKLLIDDKNADQIVLTTLFIHLGEYSYKLGDVRMAIAGYAGTIEKFEKANNLKNNSMAFNAIYNLAEIFKQQHEYSKAKEYYNLLIKTQEGYNPDYDISMSMAFYSLGYIYQKEGDYQKALQYYDNCNRGIVYYKHTEEPEAKELMCHSYKGLGDILILKNNPVEAIKSLKLSLNLSNNNDKEILSDIYNRLGSAYYKQEDYKNAKNYYEQAIKIYDEYYNPSINKQNKEYQNKLRKNFPRHAKYLGNIIIVPDDKVFEAYKNLIDIYKKTHSKNINKLESDLNAYEKAYSQNFRDFMQKSN